MALFAGLDRAHGVHITTKKAAEGAKQKGKAFTEHKPVTAELWEQHLKGERGVGIVPIRDDGTVYWSAIDVDVYGGELDHAALEKKLLELRLPLVVMRSKSGGAHLVLFCAEPVPAKFVRVKLAAWAVLIGYAGVEIFPKQDEITRPGDVGNWLNMPYFDHAKTTRYAIWDGKPLSAEEFLTKAATRRVTKEQLASFNTNSEGLFDDGPPCLQHLVTHGFPKGTRNRGLFNIGVLVRFSGSDDWKERLDAANRSYMSPPLSTPEVSTTIKSLSRKQYFYTCSQDPLVSVCNKVLCKQRKYGIGNSDKSVPPVAIDHLVKYLMEPPIYEVTVEGVKFQCSAPQLLSQAAFKLLVMEKVNRIVPTLKASVWEAMIGERLESREDLPAPKDAGPEGQFHAHLEAFCTSRVTANTLDEILLGKPFIDTKANRAYFRSADLIRYLEQQHFRDFPERRIWALLKNNGADHHQFMIKGKCVTAWSIAAPGQQTEGHNIPDMDGDEL